MKQSDNRILVIDDDSSVLDIYREILVTIPQHSTAPHHPGQQVYEVACADSGEAGVQQVITALEHDQPFAVAFVDMSLTGIDGAETARRIWALDPQVKIVIVTGSQYPPDAIIQITQREDLFYLRKPFNVEEIHQFARALTHQWRLEYDKERLTAQLRALRHTEIKIAADIQESLLFGDVPDAVEGLSIARLMLASQEVDGDFVNFFKPNDVCLDLVMGDVMGKGVPAALLGVATINRFFQAFYQLGVVEAPGQLPEPAMIVTFVRDHMAAHLEAMDAFITLCYARFNLKTRQVQYVSCGHAPYIHLDTSSHTFDWLEGDNMPLGFPDPLSIVQRDVPFKATDLFFFYSDGLTEARNPTGDLFGDQRLQTLIAANATRDSQAIIQAVQASVTAFVGHSTMRDDVTCVAVRITT
jgi:sigma-B regulation protein RsbU (phosphoserine phosphatase)